LNRKGGDGGGMSVVTGGQCGGSWAGVGVWGVMKPGGGSYKKRDNLS